jgi:hypothetical protein
MAFLLLHDASCTSLQAAMERVRLHDTRAPRVAATTRNTFVDELAVIAQRAGKGGA